MNHRLLLNSFVLATAVGLTASVRPASAQQPAIPCDGITDTPSFLSAANDVYYGCGYLLATPPQFALAQNYFRQALAKEPGNAAAHFLLGITLAGKGSGDAARAAFEQAEAADGAIGRKVEFLFQRNGALRTLVADARAGRDAAPPAAAPRTTPAASAPVANRPASNPRTPAAKAPTANPAASSTSPACGGSKPNCKPTAPPPLGSYTCDVTNWDVSERRVKYDYKGYFVLQPGGRYRWLDNGGTGQYAYDAATHRVRWLSGPLQAQGGRATYGLDVRTPEITILIETDYSRRTGNAPQAWQCGLSKK